MKKTNLVNVIDIEATCWTGAAPTCMVSEIIEVGIAVVDVMTKVVICAESYIVLPMESTVSDFCTELTTLTPEYVQEHGNDFEAVLAILSKDYASLIRPWVSWGDYDRNMFQKQCLRRDVRYPFGQRHTNLKTVYSMMNALDKELGLGRAVKHEGLKFTGTQHRGVDDAKNIATLLIQLMR